jgi:DNA-binding Xre family transcriptional regulator
MRNTNLLDADDLKPHKVVAVRLKKLRADREESIFKAAIGAKISPATLKVLESGEKDYRIVTLYKICQYYNVDPCDLLREACKEIES